MSRNKAHVIVRKQLNTDQFRVTPGVSRASTLDERSSSTKFKEIDKVFHPRFIEMLGKDIQKI
jgi:hypothetical protein